MYWYIPTTLWLKLLDGRYNACHYCFTPNVLPWFETLSSWSLTTMSLHLASCHANMTPCNVWLHATCLHIVMICHFNRKVDHPIYFPLMLYRKLTRAIECLTFYMVWKPHGFALWFYYITFKSHNIGPLDACPSIMFSHSFASPSPMVLEPYDFLCIGLIVKV